MTVTGEDIERLAAVVFFAAIFLTSGKLNLPRMTRRARRCLVSFAAGTSVAYVFVHLLPQLHTARNVFVEATARRSLPMPTHRVYISAMVGFMLFYSLEHMLHRARAEAGEAEHASHVYLLHISGFAAYAWLVSYLVVNGIEKKPAPIALYAVAMGLHFLSVDYALGTEFPRRYMRSGKYILAAAALLGWGVGIATTIPVHIVITMLGLVSGAVIMNSMIMELPQEKEGKFLPFILGGVFYAAISLLAEAAAHP